MRYLGHMEIKDNKSKMLYLVQLPRAHDDVIFIAEG